MVSYYLAMHLIKIYHKAEQYCVILVRPQKLMSDSFLAVKIKQILALLTLFLLIPFRRPFTIIVIIESSAIRTFVAPPRFSAAASKEMRNADDATFDLSDDGRGGGFSGGDELELCQMHEIFKIAGLIHVQKIGTLH